MKLVVKNKMVKAGNRDVVSLLPATKKSFDKVQKLRKNQVYEVKIERIRCYSSHKFYFGVLVLFYNNTDFGSIQPTFEKWRKDIEFTAGHTETRCNLLTGEYYQAPESISYAKLNEDEFEKVRKGVFAVLGQINSELLDSCIKNFDKL